MKHLKRIKWWFQRANRKLPPCDWWDYKYNLADFIKQGISALLYEGGTDWDSAHHKKQKKELEYILKWAIEFPYYASAIIVYDAEDYAITKKIFENDSDVMIISQKEFEAFNKRTKKAFTLLAKNIHGLWD